MKSVLTILALVVSLNSFAAEPVAPKGELWPGGVWAKDGQFYEKGSFIWIRQSDWDTYQRDLSVWSKSVGQTFAASAAPVAADPTNGAFDALNAARAKRGLRPYVQDPALSRAAKAVAEYRAARQIAGHTSNDFSFLEPGSSAKVAGCAAWPVEMGWGSCAAYENWGAVGAGWAMGKDGRRYMHLYAR